MFASPIAAPADTAALVQADEGLASLVRAIATKRPGSDRILVDRFKGHIGRLLTRMLGPGPDIEDLMQDVLFRVFQRLHKIDPPDALPGYVTSVTVLVAREAIRKRKRSRWLSFFSNQELVDLTSTHGSADVPEDVRSFYGAMAKLSTHSRLCITLRYVEGMGLEEMGAAMDLSLATVKRHLKRGEDELTAVLGNDEQHVAPWLRGAVR
jgi:RNA polymerase sigma-70 factor (ECF subfamily)